MRSHLARTAVAAHPRAAVVAAHPRTLCASTSWGGAGGTVSQSRLEEFVKAEAHYFAQQRWQKSMEPLTFPQLVSQSSSPEAMEELLRRELPIRFAARISHIEKIQQWEKIPELGELHRMHTKSFRELRLAEVRGETNVSEVVQRIRLRHLQIAPLFAEAVNSMHNFFLADFSSSPDKKASSSYEQRWQNRGSVGGPRKAFEGGIMDFQALDDWADRFLESRISTELMMTHYLEMLHGGDQDRMHGIIDKSCDPYEVCLQAAEKASKVGSSLDLGTPSACVINVKKPRNLISMCHTPRYLYYIVHELLAHSAQNTLKSCDGSSAAMEARPINITVCADDVDIAVRISDQGGGFATGDAASKWSYSTHLSSCSDDFPSEAESKPELESAGDDAAGELKPAALEQNPLSGRGIGLPLCRMYARYLGGTLEAMNMPGEGVDTYLMLKRMDLA